MPENRRRRGTCVRSFMLFLVLISFCHYTNVYIYSNSDGGESSALPSRHVCFYHNAQSLTWWSACDDNIFTSLLRSRPEQSEVDLSDRTRAVYLRRFSPQESSGYPGEMPVWGACCCGCCRNKRIITSKRSRVKLRWIISIAGEMYNSERLERIIYYESWRPPAEGSLCCGHAIVDICSLALFYKYK